jgi:hypothetical protein
MIAPILLCTGYLACWILSTRNALVSGARNRGVWIFTALLLTVGASSLFAAWCIGSHLDHEGVLQEPFYLIGGGTLLCLAGSFITVVMVVWGLFRRGTAVSRGAN